MGHGKGCFLELSSEKIKSKKKIKQLLNVTELLKLNYVQNLFKE